MSEEHVKPAEYAFPFELHVPGGKYYAAPGMELRDWFAGHALAGLMAHAFTLDASEYYARLAYEAADAMMRARKAKPGEGK